MTTFDDREKANELKFAREEELTFKAAARRNALLAEWAGEEIKYSQEEINEFAAELIKFDLTEKGYEDVFQMLSEKFAASHVEMSEHRIRKAMERLMEVARLDIIDKM
jgi:hypothetical protein